MTAWRIRTRFRELVVSVNRGGVGVASPVSPLLTDLRFELAAGSRDAVRTLSEIRTALGHVPIAAGDLFGNLENALHEGTLWIQEVRPVTVPSDFLDVGDEAEPEPEEEKELTFIEVQLKDDDGKPVTNRKVRMELPDGQVRELFVGHGGSVRVDGIESPGTATVEVFPPDADGEVVEEERAAFVEVVVVDEAGYPVEGLDLSVAFDGQTESGTTDADGLFRLDADLPAQVEVKVDEEAEDGEAAA